MNQIPKEPAFIRSVEASRFPDTVVRGCSPVRLTSILHKIHSMTGITKGPQCIPSAWCAGYWSNAHTAPAAASLPVATDPSPVSTPLSSAGARCNTHRLWGLGSPLTPATVREQVKTGVWMRGAGLTEHTLGKTQGLTTPGKRLSPTRPFSL